MRICPPFCAPIIPFGNILGPLVIWLIKREQMPFVDDQGKEAFNFQVSFMIYQIVLAVPSWLICFVPNMILAIAQIVYMIIATIEANKGHRYRYPLTIRFLK